MCNTLITVSRFISKSGL